MPAAPARHQDEQFRQLVLGVKDYAIFMLDADGHISSWNAGAERIKGYRADEVVGRHFSIFYPEETVQRGWPEQELQSARERGSFEDEGWRLRKDGTRFWANVVITAIYDERGEHLGFAKVTRDLTERRRAETDLRAAHDQLERRVAERTAELTAINEHLRSEVARRTALEAELRRLAAQLEASVVELGEADRRKNEFLAMLAHELRNPMAPIANGLELLTATVTDPSASATLQRMERQMHILARLVDDLLDVARIMQGRIELRRAPTDVAEVVKSALETASPVIDARGHLISLSLPDPPLRIDGDPVRIAQVLSNLLVNAAKYSDEPSRIELEAAGDPNQVTITVRDHGIGIAADFIPRIFDLFTQAEPSLDRSRGGLGIGLTLSRRLVELHGGTLTASSKGRGKGSQFVVRLPAAVGVGESPHRADAAPTVPAPVPRRVLVVDDSADAADSTCALIRHWGYRCEALHSPGQVLDTVLRFRPDVVLLDIGLPGMSGYDIARLLRREECGRSLLLVAMTGYGSDEDRRESAAAGFDHHLVKPVDLDRLRSILDSGAPGAAELAQQPPG
jgi:PAS domain S-box-containing protein